MGNDASAPTDQEEGRLYLYRSRLGRHQRDREPNNTSYVERSYATGYVSGTDRVGGLIGNSGVDIFESYATGSANATAATSTVGGLLGFSNRPVSDCYATGAVIGESNVGGLIGLLSGNVTDSYAVGLVTGTSNTGGLIGSRQLGTITASYFDEGTTGQTGGEGVGWVTAQVKSEATYTNWDFLTTWDIVETVSYPFLRNLPQNPVPQ